MIILSILIVTVYITLIVYISIGFNRVLIYMPEQVQETCQFSILIPFRNEEENLQQLINSITALDYPKDLFEVIFINDNSDDSSAEIIHQLIDNSSINCSIIDNNRFSNSPKKDAITLGVKNAKYNWIATTDADCIIPKEWLKYFSQFIEVNNPNLICGPVAYNNVNSWLSHFQNFELLSLMNFTIGTFGNKKPFLCNGANLCYHKSLFEKVNGYANNNHIASGDDVFLLENALAIDSTKVHFIKSKELLVLTNPESSLKCTIQQRIRWASKSSHYKNTFGKLIGILILLMNGLLVSLTVLSIVDFNYIQIFAFAFFMKIIADGLIIARTKSFLQDKKLSLFHYITSSLAYPFFSVYVAVQSVFLPYKWKGRRFNK